MTQQLISWLTAIPVAHLVAIVAIAVLLALGTVTTAVGLPLLAGLLGLALPSTSAPQPAITTPKDVTK